MATRIKLTDEDIQEEIASFEKTLRETKSSTGELTYTVDLNNEDERATLRFTERAYLKMLALVEKSDKEIGWHGIATRGEGNEYIVSDIMVYPQVVSAANIDPDQVKYQNWLYEFDDETFKNIRFQGHSHVNMGTTPSTTDWDFYRKLLSQLDETMFYIFVVWNKRGEKTVIIFDMAKNLRFDTKDVDIVVGNPGEEIEKFAKEEIAAKVTTYASTVKTVPVAKTQTHSGNYGTSYGTSYGAGNRGYARRVDDYDYDDYDGFYGAGVKGKRR